MGTRLELNMAALDKIGAVIFVCAWDFGTTFHKVSFPFLNLEHSIYTHAKFNPHWTSKTRPGGANYDLFSLDSLFAMLFRRRIVLSLPSSPVSWFVWPTSRSHFANFSRNMRDVNILEVWPQKSFAGSFAVYSTDAVFLNPVLRLCSLILFLLCYISLILFYVAN